MMRFHPYRPEIAARKIARSSPGSALWRVAWELGNEHSAELGIAAIGEPGDLRAGCDRYVGLIDRGFGHAHAPGWQKSLWNACSEALSPSSVNCIDLALLTVSEMCPLACSRLIASQSKLFQARPSSCRPK
jgi:hypothetical protein